MIMFAKKLPLKKLDDWKGIGTIRIFLKICGSTEEKQRADSTIRRISIVVKEITAKVWSGKIKESTMNTGWDKKTEEKTRCMSVCECDDCNNSTMTWEILKSRQIDGPKYGRGGEIYVQTNQAWQYTSVTSVQPITSRQGKTKRNVNPPLSMSLLW